MSNEGKDPLKEDPEKVVQFWQNKLQELEQELHKLGADNASPRIDLKSGKIYWREESDGQGQNIAEAEVVILCTYAPDEESLLMGWSNESLPSLVKPKKINKLPGRKNDLTKDDATQYAMYAASAIEVDYIYTAETQRNVIYLGLTNLQSSADEEEAGPLESPALYVRSTLEDLYTALEQDREPLENLGNLYMEHGEQLIEQGQTNYGETDYAEPMIKAGETLVYKGKELMAGAYEGFGARKKKAILKELNEHLEKWEGIQ